MKTRIKHTLYLTPSILLILMWIVAAPSLVEQRSTWEILVAALVTAVVAAWCITLFAHSLQRDKS